MILVSVGSSEFAFDRLLEALDSLPTDEELVVQHGPSAVRPSGARCFGFVPFEELSTLVRDARVVVTHAGVGSILLSLTHGKTPIVVPRRKSFRETVDDHQLECARRFGRDGLVAVVEDLALLGAAVTMHAESRTQLPSSKDVPLVAELRTYIQRAVERAGTNS